MTNNLKSQVFTIKSGTASAKVKINLVGNRAIASIGTKSNITADDSIYFKIKTYFKKLDTWLYVYDVSKGKDVELFIVPNKSIAFAPFTDLRGEEEIEFELNQIQLNDVSFEIKFTEI